MVWWLDVDDGDATAAALLHFRLTHSFVSHTLIHPLTQPTPLLSRHRSHSPDPIAAATVMSDVSLSGFVNVAKLEDVIHSLLQRMVSRTRTERRHRLEQRRQSVSQSVRRPAGGLTDGGRQTTAHQQAQNARIDTVSGHGAKEKEEERPRYRPDEHTHDPDSHTPRALFVCFCLSGRRCCHRTRSSRGSTRWSAAPHSRSL